MEAHQKWATKRLIGWQHCLRLVADKQHRENKYQKWAGSTNSNKPSKVHDYMVWMRVFYERAVYVWGWLEFVFLIRNSDFLCLALTCAWIGNFSFIVHNLTYLYPTPNSFSTASGKQNWLSQPISSLFFFFSFLKSKVISQPQIHQTTTSTMCNKSGSVYVWSMYRNGHGRDIII